MILGMSLSTFTTFHVVLSLIGIVAGFITLFGMLAGKWLNGWNALFLITTIATSVTGYFFPVDKVLPSHIVGAISLVALVVALAALYGYHLAGAWRATYVAAASLALYLNVFVGVVQSFQKVSFLQPLAPTQSEPPFIVAQVAVMVILIVLGFFAAKRFHPGAMAAA